MQIARIHHEIAVLARRRRGSKGWESWSQVADAIPELGVGGIQLRAIMRGEAGLSMRHAVGLNQRLGPLFMGGFGVQAMLRENQELRQRLRETLGRD